jgi:DNA-binding CsgD family transcriptional regulator
VLISEPGRRVIMGIHSGREFDQDRIILCRRLTPHLQRALEITLRTLDLRTKATRSAELLDLMEDAIAVVDYNRRPLLMNKAAEALVSPGGALRVECGRLTARSPYESEKLLGLLKSCFGDDREERGGRMRLANAQAEPLDVIVTPMAESGPWPHASPATALVFVKIPRRLSLPDRQELQGLHGLTPAETAMALRLCEGMTLQKAAASQGVRVSTARTHLKHIFDKTGACRQTELVQRLLTQQASQEVPSRPLAGAQ